tara:strand:- start:1109 stop:1555 length:447 start_codon:yes stop_codon:yes gene_type:complete
MDFDVYKDGAHAACEVEVHTIGHPSGYSLVVIQNWVQTEYKLTGRKADLADYLVRETMRWWTTRPFGNAGFESKKSAYTALKQHLTARAKERYSAVQGFLLYLTIGSAVTIVSKMIVNWIFGDEGIQKDVHENRGIYFVEPFVTREDD